MRCASRRTRIALLSLWPLLASCGDGSSVLALTSIAPDRASARGGDLITLSGHGFGASPRVRFGSDEVQVSSASDTEVVVVAPRATASTVTVTVEAAKQQAQLVGAFTFDALPLTFVDVAWPRVIPLPVDGGSCAIADGDVYQAARGEGVWLYQNDGKGGLGAAKLLRPDDDEPCDVVSVVAEDLDGDGHVDLFLGATNHAPSRILLGDGKLGFAPRPGALPDLFGVEQTAIAVDLDGDGALDLVAVGTALTDDGPPGVIILANDGQGTFHDVTAKRLPDATFNATGVAAGDVDGDGHVDLFFAGDQEASRLYLNDGRGTLWRAPPDALPNDTAPGAGIPALGDLDGDGALDIYLPTTGQDRVLSNDGTGHFLDVTDLVLGPESAAGRSAVIDDLDLDGHADVVVVERPGRLRLLRNDGAGRLFDYSGDMAGNGSSLVNAGVALGDIDGDGDVDLFVSRAGFARAALFSSWSPTPFKDRDDDGFPDAIDNCPAAPNPDQANADSLPFGCESAAACMAQTNCDLRPAGTSAYLVCGGEKASWDEASAACQARGGQLVTITNADENAFLVGLGVADAWIGLSDTVTEGSFAWVSGQSAHTNWAMDQPDDAGGNEDCAVLLADGTWNDAPCDQKRGYVCESARSPAPDPGDACDACATKYEPGTAPVMLGDAGTCGGEDPDAGAP